MVVLLIVVQPWMMPPVGHDAPSYSLLSLKSLLEICVLGKNRPKRFLPASTLACSMPKKETHIPIDTLEDVYTYWQQLVEEQSKQLAHRMNAQMSKSISVRPVN